MNLSASHSCFDAWQDDETSIQQRRWNNCNYNDINKVSKGSSLTFFSYIYGRTTDIKNTWK